VSLLLSLSQGDRKLSSNPTVPATFALELAACVRAMSVLTSNKTLRPLHVLHDGTEDTERHLHNRDTTAQSST
jgi:hypothetical protein